MTIFPSLEWYQELGNLLNNNKDYAKAAAKQEGAFCFWIKAEPGKVEKDILIFMKVTLGKIEEVAELQSSEDRKLDFLLTAPYSVWKDIVVGKLDSTMALMKGKLKVKGDMGKLLRQSKSSNIMATQYKYIPTKYIDEA